MVNYRSIFITLAPGGSSDLKDRKNPVEIMSASIRPFRKNIITDLRIILWYYTIGAESSSIEHRRKYTVYLASIIKFRKVNSALEATDNTDDKCIHFLM